MEIGLIIPAFVAGIITFLAPCTLPLVPAYLGFISGVSAKDFQDEEKLKAVRGKVILNGFLYVTGFSFVFIALGIIFGLGGIALAGLQVWLARIGGVVVILFGLYMMNVIKIPGLNFLNREHHFGILGKLKPGTPTAALVFGATFAFGWTPCVGPVLGSVLLLASSGTTILQGGFLLFVFSLGLAIPFMAIAFGVGHATQTIKKLTKILPYISFIGGVFLIFLGILLVTDSLSFWLSWSYQLFSFINYEALLNHL